MSSSKKVLKLKSSDDIIFKVSLAAAMQSRMLKGMIEEDDTVVHEVGKDGVIPIPKVDSQTLKMVIDYWNKHLDEKANENKHKKWDVQFVNKDQSLLYDLLMAANYLDAEKLLKLICWKVAEMIKGKEPEEIRQIFNIKNDLNSKEAFRTMKDHMNPPKMIAPPCIVPPQLQDFEFNMRLQISSLVPIFHGMESENPYTHIKDFEDVCHTFHEEGVSIDMMRLVFFPFTLRDGAKVWLNSLTPRSIRTWTELQAEFFKKFFRPNQNTALKKQIINFTAKEDEKFYACWERYIVTVNACPDHGFDTWLLVSYFYKGMTPFMKQLVETMSGEEFMSKVPEEAMNFLNDVAEASRGWDEQNVRMTKKAKTNNF